MEIIFIICVIFFGFFGIFFAYQKSKSKGILSEITSSHKIDMSFATTSGCLAFSDAEQNIIFYSTTTNEKVSISYNNLIRADKFDEKSNLVLFTAMNPKLTQYQFGAKNAENLSEILRKMDSILKVNLTKIQNEYESKISIPQSAATVKVKRYEGIDADIPSGLLSTENTYIWVEDSKLHLMSKLASLPDYRVRPNAYNPIIIDIKSVVELSQGGEVHYTTQVHGGGGGGTSIKGAIIGGVLAGEAGAIIGSRKPTDPITSTTQKIDDRATHMKVLDSNNKFFEIVFEYNDYYVISKLMGI